MVVSRLCWERSALFFPHVLLRLCPKRGIPFLGSKGQYTLMEQLYTHAQTPCPLTSGSSPLSLDMSPHVTFLAFSQPTETSWRREFSHLPSQKNNPFYLLASIFFFPEPGIYLCSSALHPQLDSPKSQPLPEMPSSRLALARNHFVLSQFLTCYRSHLQFS